MYLHALFIELAVCRIPPNGSSGGCTTKNSFTCWIRRTITNNRTLSATSEHGARLCAVIQQKKEFETDTENFDVSVTSLGLLRLTIH